MEMCGTCNASCRLSSVACVSRASRRKDAAWAHPDLRPFASPYHHTNTNTRRGESQAGCTEGRSRAREGEVHEEGEGTVSSKTDRVEG